MTAPTPENVAEHATQTDVLDAGLALLGLFGPEENLKALLRMPSGRIREITPGTKLSQGTVVAIDHEGLVLSRGNKTHRLRMLA